MSEKIPNKFTETGIRRNIVFINGKLLAIDFGLSLDEPTSQEMGSENKKFSPPVDNELPF